MLPLGSRLDQGKNPIACDDDAGDGRGWPVGSSGGAGGTRSIESDGGVPISNPPHCSLTAAHTPSPHLSSDPSPIRTVRRLILLLLPPVLLPASRQQAISASGGVRAEATHLEQAKRHSAGEEDDEEARYATARRGAGGEDARSGHGGRDDL